MTGSPEGPRNKGDQHKHVRAGPNPPQSALKNGRALGEQSETLRGELVSYGAERGNASNAGEQSEGIGGAPAKALGGPK